MVRFALPGAGAPLVQTALRVVAVHGATDAWVHPPSWLLAYAPAALPWPCTTPAFLVASVVHFARDVGAGGSVALHATWAALCVRSVRAAVRAALLYMMVLHVPLHYRAVAASAAGTGWAAGMALLTALVVAFGPRVAALPEWAQRIVCVHVLLDELRRRA